MSLKEAIKTIDALWEAAEQRGEDFWVAALAGSYENPVVDGLTSWAKNQGLYLYGVYSTSDKPEYLGDPSDRFSEVCWVDDPWATIEEFVSGSKTDAVLAIIPEDPTELLYEDTQLINRCISGGTAVYDMAAQMSEVTLESEEPSAPQEPDAPVEEPEALHETPLVAPTSFVLTYEDYDELTLSELKAQCLNLGLEIEGDKRAKDPYITALLAHHIGDVQTGSTAPEPVSEPQQVLEIAQAIQADPEIPTEPQEAPPVPEWENDPEAYQEAVEAFSADQDATVAKVGPNQWCLRVERHTTWQKVIEAPSFAEASAESVVFLAATNDGNEDPFTDQMTTDVFKIS